MAGVSEKIGGWRRGIIAGVFVFLLVVLAFAAVPNSFFHNSLRFIAWNFGFLSSPALPATLSAMPDKVVSVEIRRVDPKHVQAILDEVKNNLDTLESAGNKLNEATILKRNLRLNGVISSPADSGLRATIAYRNEANKSWLVTAAEKYREQPVEFSLAVLATDQALQQLLQNPPANPNAAKDAQKLLMAIGVIGLPNELSSKEVMAMLTKPNQTLEAIVAKIFPAGDKRAENFAKKINEMNTKFSLVRGYPTIELIDNKQGISTFLSFFGREQVVVANSRESLALLLGKIGATASDAVDPSLTLRIQIDFKRISTALASAKQNIVLSMLSAVESFDLQWRFGAEIGLEAEVKTRGKELAQQIYAFAKLFVESQLKQKYANFGATLFKSYTLDASDNSLKLSFKMTLEESIGFFRAAVESKSSEAEQVSLVATGLENLLRDKVVSVIDARGIPENPRNLRIEAPYGGQRLPLALVAKLKCESPAQGTIEIRNLKNQSLVSWNELGEANPDFDANSKNWKTDKLGNLVLGVKFAPGLMIKDDIEIAFKSSGDASTSTNCVLAAQETSLYVEREERSQREAINLAWSSKAIPEKKYFTTLAPTATKSTNECVDLNLDLRTLTRDSGQLGNLKGENAENEGQIPAPSSTLAWSKQRRI